MEIVAYGGWERCARLTMRDIEVIVTLEVGPRILHFGFVGGENEFVVHDKDAGHTGGDAFHSYGGHRLWIAPELPATTLLPDNEPVETSVRDEFAEFRSKTDANCLQKEIAIALDPAGNCVRIRHRIYNRGGFGVVLAPWAPTQMAPGGECIFPQAPYESHADRLLPVRPIVLWAYTRMDDPRWTWASEIVRLRHDANLGPTKIGALVQQGYAAYSNRGNLFLKRFPYLESANYPDFQSNFETFTREDMLEIESLGPLATVEPGRYAEHLETWYLLRQETPPTDSHECADWLSQIAGRCPL